VLHNCLDRHVEAGSGGRVAFHWAGEEGEQRAIAYAELHRDVQRLANALKELGVGNGDVVGIYLPMIPEVVVAMLACARIGAPHNVVFGGFAPEAVRERMEVSHAKALITVDGGRRKGKTAPVKPAVDTVMGDLESLEHIVVVRHTGIDVPMRPGRDVVYDEILAAADDVCPAEPMEAEHPLFILYSSGSTAKPVQPPVAAPGGASHADRGGRQGSQRPVTQRPHACRTPARRPVAHRQGGRTSLPDRRAGERRRPDLRFPRPQLTDPSSPVGAARWRRAQSVGWTPWPGHERRRIGRQRHEWPVAGRDGPAGSGAWALAGRTGQGAQAGLGDVA
jgi:hypothetical protein